MMQIIEQTHDETVAMYMKGCTKKQLAEMLANCNELLQQQRTIQMPNYTQGSFPSECDHQWVNDTAGSRCVKCGKSGNLPLYEITCKSVNGTQTI